jgi:hypothetical protein
MPGLVPGIYVLQRGNMKNVDGRDKPGHAASMSEEAARVVAFWRASGGCRKVIFEPPVGGHCAQ